MAYDVTLVQLNATIAGPLAISLTGFPAVPWNYLLMSYWLCLPNTDPLAGGCDLAVEFIDNIEALFNGSNYVLRLNYVPPGFAQPVTAFFDAAYTAPVANVRVNVLVSVNCLTQTTQVYINDTAPPLASGGWVSNNKFDAVRSFNIFALDIGTGLGSDRPAFADFWLQATPGFIDLSIEANRRKFINADLSPVYLGADGSSPFGTSPPIYLTVPSGGVPTDILHNYGTGGAFAWGGSLTFQTPGTCHLPTPPHIDVNVNLTNGVEADFGITAPTSISGMTTIGISELEVTDLALSFTSPVTADEQVTLRWSDDAGASWSNGLLRSLGEAGEYFTAPTWYRLGMSRNRILELSWSGARAEALQGVFVDVTISST